MTSTPSTSLAVALVALVGLAAAQCSSSDCEYCYSSDGCGWCASTQTCVAGADAGPTFGSCAAWYYEQCPYCSNEYSCVGCLYEAGCGWCTNSIGSTFCVEGNATRPYNGDVCTSWITGVPASCPVPTPAPPQCSQWSGTGYCNSCVDTSGCGWCETTQSCYVGDHTGPSSNITCPNWFLTCPNCAYQTTCSSCTSTMYCGWCSTANTCSAGNSSGNFRGTCFGAAWTTNGTTCGSPAPPSLPPAYSCNGYTTCATCMDLYGCGWCAATKQCIPGLSGAPPGCPAAAWYPAPNAVCPACSSHLTCEGCRLDGGCGWCATTSFPSGCLQGNATGPYDATCSGRWTKYPSTCASCGSLTTCTACTGSNSGNCGWCGTTNRCVSGTTSGPVVGSCGDWIYYSDNCPFQSSTQRGAAAVAENVANAKASP